MTDPMLDLSAHRARKEAAERDYAARRELERLDSKAALDALMARCRDLSAAAVDGRAIEAERVERRRERLREAGVPTPRGGTPQHAAWERVTRAACAEQAAYPGHDGSARAMRAVDRWLQPGARSTVIFVGDPGAGKTVAAWYALACEGGLYLPAREIAPTRAWDDTLPRAARAGLLVINDLHERMSAWAWASVAQLVEDRHDAGKRTLITSNLTGARLMSADMLGARVASRVGPHSSGQGAILKIDGGDLRAGGQR